MSFKSSINHYRRKITKGITASLVSLLFPKGKEAPPREVQVQRILIVRPNSRLGNQLMLSPLIETMIGLYPNSKIHLFVRGGLSDVLYKNHSHVEFIHKLPGKPYKELKAYIASWVTLRRQTYDWSINVDYDSSSGRLATLLSKSKFKLLGKPDVAFFNTFLDYRHMAKQPIYHVRQALQWSVNEMKAHEMPNFNIRLLADELEVGRQKLMELSQQNPKIIGIFTFATGDKIISKEWWSRCLAELRARYPQHAIIEFLPKENVSQVDFAVPSFNSFDLRCITAMMHHCDFVIAADSGMMHLASASGSQTVGLFKVTDATKYGPYNNNSFVFNPEKEDMGLLFTRLHEVR